MYPGLGLCSICGRYPADTPVLIGDTCKIVHGVAVFIETALLADFVKKSRVRWVREGHHNTCTLLIVDSRCNLSEQICGLHTSPKHLPTHTWKSTVAALWHCLYPGSNFASISKPAQIGFLSGGLNSLLNHLWYSGAISLFTPQDQLLTSGCFITFVTSSAALWIMVSSKGMLHAQLLLQRGVAAYAHLWCCCGNSPTVMLSFYSPPPSQDSFWSWPTLPQKRLP